MSSASDLQGYIHGWRSEIQTRQADGRLSRSLQSSFSLTPSEIEKFGNNQELLRELIGVDIEILDDAGLGRLLGAYSPSSQTIYLNEKLGQDDKLAVYVLTHELGHHLSSQLELGYADHADISRFVEAIYPGAIQQSTSGLLESAQVEKPSQITLPNGDKLHVQQFDTSIHNNFTAEALPMLSKAGRDLLAYTQQVVDNISGTGLSLQYYSFQHFDNNNISGSTAAIKRWYEDGLNNFNNQNIPSRKDKINGFVNPAFNTRNSFQLDPIKPFTSDPGIGHLIWRFGQVAHALQDFYAHSNWVELVQAGKINRGEILLENQELPSVFKPGQYLPNKWPYVLVAEKGGNFDGFVHYGTGSYKHLPSEKHDIWFQVASDDTQPNKPKGTAWANSRFGSVVGALMTGATNEYLYSDPILNMSMIDFTQNSGKGFFYRGLDHGGIAGVRGNTYDQRDYVGPLNKDKSSAPLHRLSKAYSAIQLQNEWDRLGNLINKTYGREGLIRFAKLAVSEENRQEYINTYSRGRKWNWSYIQGFEYPGGGSGPSSSSKQLVSSLPPIRIIEIFRKNSSDLDAEKSYGKLQFQSTDGKWLDSSVESFDVHHEDLTDEDIAEIVIPSKIQHVDAGQRGLWKTASNDPRDTNGTTFFIEASNRDVGVVIDNFDIFSDSIVIVNSDGLEQRVSSSYSTYNGFIGLRTLLKEEYNVDLYATPIVDGALNKWFISKQELSQIAKKDRRNHSSPQFLTLTASQLFDDPNVISGGKTRGSDPTETRLESNLYFSDYDESLPFLKLVDGKLVASSDITKYAGKSYQALVNVSDGHSLLGSQLIDISIAPTITISDGKTNHTFDANQLFSLRLPLILQDAYSILVSLSDDDPTTSDYLEIIASQTGADQGSSPLIRSESQCVTLGPETRSGSARFWVEKKDSADLEELFVRTASNGSFELYSASNQLYASLGSVAGNAGAFIDFDRFEIKDENWSQVGFLYDPTKTALTFDVTSDNASQRSIGVFMTDVVTGALVNPRNGDLAVLDSTSIKDLIDSWAVFSQEIPSSGKVSFAPVLQPSANIDYDNIVWSPFVKQRDNAGSSYYFANGYLNQDGLDHGLKLSRNSIGFEGSGLTGNPDFNDVIISIVST